METASDDEIVKALELLNNELTTQSQGTTEVAKKEDLTSFDTLAEKILSRLNDVDGIADKTYELFYHDLALGKDHSESSKIALLESLKVKMESPKTLVELTKALAKLQAASSKAQVGIQINTQSGEAVGINLDNLREEC